jgi:hypothetical protein
MEAAEDYLKRTRTVSGSIVDQTRLVLTDHFLEPATSETYEFIKVDLQPVGTPSLPDSSQLLLKGAKIELRFAGPLQKLGPRVAERLRSCGAEVQGILKQLAEPISIGFSVTRTDKRMSRSESPIC